MMRRHELFDPQLDHDKLHPEDVHDEGPVERNGRLCVACRRTQKPVSIHEIRHPLAPKALFDKASELRHLTEPGSGTSL